MAVDASGAVVMSYTSVPVHLAGGPGGTNGPGGRVLDIDSDGQPDLGIYESTVCTDDDPPSSCRSTIIVRGLNGIVTALTGNYHIEPGAFIGTVITNPTGTVFGTYSIFSTASISQLDRKFGPPVSATPQNPFGEGVTDGLIAFRLPGDAGASHFGYLHLDYREWPVRYDNSPFQASSPILQGWAYESEADSPIEARLIPEPSGMFLGIVLSLLLGLGHRRTCRSDHYFYELENTTKFGELAGAAQPATHPDWKIP